MCTTATIATTTFRKGKRKMNRYTIDMLTKLIKIWSTERGLNEADPSKQLNKFLEEAGELAQGLNKGNKAQIKDGIGDVYVTLVILAQQLGISIEECVNTAYEEIKNRKGKLVNGTFVKEEDLK